MGLPDADYHRYDAWSYSVIARYARQGFSSLNTLRDPIQVTPAMRFGSLFDCMLTKRDSVLEEFTVMPTTIPEAERKALDYIASQTHEPLADIDREDFIKYCDDCEYWRKWKYETRLSHLMQYDTYYQALCSGKTVVDAEEWKDALEIYNIFKTHPYLKTLFGNSKTEDKEYLYQLQFLADVDIDGDKLPVKIMPDLLVVDHKAKTIQPVDLKTSSSPAYDFLDSFLRMRYDIQASLYTDVLSSIIEKDDDYWQYDILPYLFVDVGRTDKTPLTFIYDPKSETQKDGLTYRRNGNLYTYKHWKTLLKEIVSYQKQKAKVPEGFDLNAPNDLLNLIENNEKETQN